MVRAAPATAGDVDPAIACATAAFAADPMMHFFFGGSRMGVQAAAVDPRLQGRGLGRALIEDFCALSEADPRSGGVYLETGSAESLAFYLRNGFVVRGEESLGAAPLWCVFRSHAPCMGPKVNCPTGPPRPLMGA